MPFTGAGAFQEIGVKAVVKDVGTFMSDLGRMDKAVQGTGQKLQTLGKGMTSVGQKLTMGLTLPILAVSGLALKASIDFESAFAGVRKTVDATEEEFAALRQGIRDMAKEMPASVAEISKVAEAAGALGIAKSYILDFSRIMIDMGETTDLTADESAMAMARIANIMQMPQDQFDNLGSAIVDLGNKGASTEREIVEMALRIAGAGNVIGLSEAQVLGFASAMASVGIEAEMGGSAVSRVFMEMAKSVAEGDERLALFAGTARLTVGEFAELFERDAAEATIRFIEGLGGVVDAGGNVFGLMEDLQLGGIRVEDTLLRASGAGQLFRDQLQIGSEAWKENTALAAEAEKRYATTSAKLEILKNKVKDAAISLGDALLPAMRDALKVMEGAVKVIAVIAKGFAELPKPVRMVIITLALLAAAIGPLLIVSGMLIQSLGMMIVFGPLVAAKLATLIPVLAALSPWMLVLIALAVILIAMGPELVAAWDSVAKFFSRDLPAALDSAINAWWELQKLLLTPVTQLVSLLRRLGYNMGMAIANGLADAAKTIWDVAKQIAEGIAYLLNPKNIVWGSTLEQVYGKAGASAAASFIGSFGKRAAKTVLAAPVVAVPGDPTYEPGGRVPTPPRPPEAPAEEEFRRELREYNAKVDVELGDTSALDDLEAEAAEAGEDAGEAGGNAFLRMLEGVVARGLGTVTTAMAAPLDALRGVVSSLADEIMRLAGLPTIESAMERLQRAQLQLKLIGVERREPQIQAARDRIAAIDEEEKALLDQRQAIIDENWGREEGVEAIDAQLAALEKEQDQKEAVIDKYEKEKQAIEDQIAALDSLAKERDAEREVMAARAQLADKTLATDQEVLAAMEKMQPVISEVTGLINKQADDLWTRFVPAWEDAYAAASGAGAGAGAGLGELGEMGAPTMPMPEPLKLEEVEEPPEPPDIEGWIKQWRIPAVLAALGLIVGVIAAAIFGWPFLLAAAIGAVVGLIVGLIIKEFGDDIAKGFQKIGALLKKHWKEVLLFLTGGMLLLGVVKGFEKVLIPGIKKALGKLIALVGDLPKHLSKHWKKLVSMALVILFSPGLTAIVVLVSRLVREVVGLFGKLVDTGKRLFSELVSKVTSLVSGMVTTVKTTVSGMVTAVIGFVANLVTQVTTKISGMVTSVITFFTNLATSVKTTVSGMITQLVSWFTALPGQILGALASLGSQLLTLATGAMTSMLSGFSTMLASVITFFAGLPGQIIGAIGDVASLLYEIGKDIVQGLIDGIGDLLPDLGGILDDLLDLLGKIPGVNLVTGAISDVGGAAKSLIGKQQGEWSVPGAGTRDSVLRAVTPGEMIVPRTVADAVRGTVSSFGQLGGAMAGQAKPLGTSPSMAMAGALSVNAPISITVVSHDWGEVRRIVHAEVDTALAGARAATTRQAAELTSGIV